MHGMGQRTMMKTSIKQSFDRNQVTDPVSPPVPLDDEIDAVYVLESIYGDKADQQAILRAHLAACRDDPGMTKFWIRVHMKIKGIACSSLLDLEKDLEAVDQEPPRD